ncbi:EamA family transporter [Caulobacter sp. BE254]|uniref:EamA family transporter n=1 Tax=Caulobacter sp. BE254 TaxID=2817720 RepID=UPI002861328E|nr:EamA family transporter [Caulobacter sp. BE254]MDR7114486.1 drug/metabolite transporter (DMT)-like permease [Caulobacter sp. BE254]
MTAIAPAPRRLAPMVLFAILPLLTLGYQIAAKASAARLAQMRFDVDWLLAAARLSSVQILLVCEVASFVAWMTVLAEMPLSAAFPLSAVSYVLIIAASALVFHEPVGLLQVVGSLAILVGVWLIGRGGRETPPGPIA